jgi:hypothetical protein
MSDTDFDDDFDPFGTDTALEGVDFGLTETDDISDKIAKFNSDVEKNMRVLLSRKADWRKRREAAFWLGESGAPKAITALRTIYLGERDKRVKEAATYALGQFKALDRAIRRDKSETVGEALQRKENARIVRLLEDITLRGRRGRRLLVPASALVRLQMVLVVTFVVLAVVNAFVLLTGGERDGLGALPLSPTRVAGLAPEAEMALDTLATLRRNVHEINRTGTILQAQYSAVIDGGELGCELIFIAVPPYTVPGQVEARYPNISILANRVNVAAAGLQTGLDIREQSCQEGRAPLQEETERATSELGQALAALPDLEAAVSSAEGSINIVAPTEVVETEEAEEEDLITPTDVPEPTPEPTATVAPETVNIHVRAMVNIISNVNARQGANTTLAQYWDDIRQAGRTEGCRQPQPQIPDNYPPIPADVLAAVPELGNAADQINIALDLLRNQGWPLFTSACANNTLAENLATGLLITETTGSAFNVANQILVNIRR